MDSLALIGLLWAILRIAVPYVMATLGGTVCERAGVINIALEGILLLSALGTALGAPYGVTAALASGIAAGVTTALLYGLLVVVFRGDGGVFSEGMDFGDWNPREALDIHG